MAVACLLGSIYLAQWGYEESFLRLNALSTDFLDQLMPHWTHLAEGAILSGVLILTLLFRRPALAITVAMGMIGLALVVAVLKQGVFPDWDRPALVFPMEQIRFLSLGQERHFSFPSGHSTVAGALYAFLCFSAPLRGAGWGIGWALLALSIAYTRIYIGVHFLGDVIAGVVLGCVIASVCLWYVYPFVERWTLSLKGNHLQTLRWCMVGLSLFLIVFATYELVQTYYL
ncbi:MAG: phosphatase PAP2 family protein [Bacteroidota bacterium]